MEWCAGAGRAGAGALQLTVRSPSIVDKMPVQQLASISAAAWGRGGGSRGERCTVGVKVGASKRPRQLGFKPRPCNAAAPRPSPCCAPETGRRPSLGNAPGWCTSGAKGCRVGSTSYTLLRIGNRRANVCHVHTLPSVRCSRRLGRYQRCRYPRATTATKLTEAAHMVALSCVVPCGG